MGRNRGKGKKQTVIATSEDLGSGEEEKIPPAKKRGRPLKMLKNENQEEEEAEKVEEENEGEATNGILSDKNSKPQVAMVNGRKRRRPSQIKENHETVKEENGMETKINASDSIKSVGFRQNGSRRKNKPRRAAEVGVECN